MATTRQEQFVSAEDTGLAQEILQRLVNERRGLENAVATLETYRAVRSQLSGAVAELDRVKKEMEKAHSDLAEVEQEYLAGVERTERGLREYRERRTAEVEGEIALLTARAADRENELQALDAEVASLKGFQEREKVEHAEALEAMRVEMESVRVEHAGLIQVIDRAAASLSGRR